MQVEGRARLFSWDARALYVGPAMNLSPHRNGVAVVALGVDGPFGVARAPGKPGTEYRRCRSVLIFPSTLHHLACGDGTMAFLYLDACSDDWTHLRRRASQRTDNAAFDLPDEVSLVSTVRELAQDPGRWKACRGEIETLLGLARSQLADRRVAAALTMLRNAAGERLSLASVAAAVGLSPSRLRHRIKAETGVSFRRYRLWTAMGYAMAHLRDGTSLTAAAMAAGFASSAHFSAAFREMFGIEPSRLVARIR